MRRLYFVLSDVATARAVVEDLLAAGVRWEDIGLIGRDDIELSGLPEAGVSRRSDLLPALRQGAGIGAVMGALAGLAAIAFPPAGLTFTGGVLVALFVVLVAGGAGFGAWVAGMIGISFPHRHLLRFQEAIERGELLIMVDLPEPRIEPVEALMQGRQSRAPGKEAGAALSPGLPLNRTRISNDVGN